MKPLKQSGSADSFEAAGIDSSLRFQAFWLLLTAVGAALLEYGQYLDMFGVWLLPALGFAFGVRLICVMLGYCRRWLVYPLAMLCLVTDVTMLSACHPEAPKTPWTFDYNDTKSDNDGKKDRAPDPPRPPATFDSIKRIIDQLNITQLAEEQCGGRQLQDKPKEAKEEKKKKPPPGSLAAAGGDSKEDKEREEEKPRNDREAESPPCMTLDCWKRRMKDECEEVEKSTDEASRSTEDWKTEQTRSKEHYIHEYIVVVCGILMQLWFTTTFVLPFRRVALVLPICLTSFLLFVVVTGREHREHSRALDGGYLVLRKVLEVSILIFGAGVNMVAKYRMECSQREVQRLMDELSKDIIQQKVLRCEAEWEKQKLEEESLQPLECITESGYEDLEVSSRQQRPPSLSKVKAVVKKGPSSLRSAPAAGRGFLEANADCGTRQRGDCLPPGAAVWIEGQAMPTSVGKVSAGQRVLCFDTIGRCPKFVEVTEMQVLAGQAEWVFITLADGTEMSVTANHPVQPQPFGCDGRLPYIGSAIPAQQLKPGEDCLMVMKLVPVPVTSISSSKGGAVPSERVALLLRQPERHEVFVAPTGAAGATVAVGSANAGMTMPGNQMQIGPVVKRTFIDVAQAPSSSLRRSNSLPPRLKDARAGPEDVDECVEITPPPPRSVAPAGLRRPSRRRRQRSNSDSELSGSFRSSESSAAAQVLLSMNQQPMEPAMLSQVMYARQIGLPSLGSNLHAQGKCQVCIFHSRHVHEGAPPCWKGVLCDRCHECHEPVMKKKQKSGSMRRFLKKCGKETAEAEG